MTIKYKVDYFKYKITDKLKFIKVYGWCFDNNDSITFEVKLDGKVQNVDVKLLKRTDVYNKYKNEINTNNLGFYIYIPLEEELKDFELTAKSNTSTSTLLKYNQKELSQHASHSSIEYHVDLVRVFKKGDCVEIAGWAYSIDKKPLKFRVFDGNNKLVSSEYEVSLRQDLVERQLIEEDQCFCGFLLRTPGLSSKGYYLEISNGNEKQLVHYNKLKVELKAQLRDGYKFVKNVSGFFQVANFSKGLNYLQKKGLRKTIQRIKQGPYPLEYDYHAWFMNHKISEEELEIQRHTKLSFSPKISIIVATYNTKDEYLKDMIDSVIDQSYPNWELCIGDGSTNDSVQNYVKEHYANEPRIKFNRLNDNYGISGNMNGALEVATGDYVSLYDHDDILCPDALFEVVSALQDYRYDIVYTDEDKLNDQTKQYMVPFFKPDYNVDMFRSHCYICHFYTVNRKIIDQVGFMRSDYDGSQDYDFMFRCIEKANGVYHVPKILYHWRMHPLSTAANPESKMYCYEAGQRAIEDHYRRTGVNATVEMIRPLYGMYRTRYHVEGQPLVSIIIPNMNHKKLLKTCIDSLFTKNTYKNFEIIIVENNSDEDEIFDYYQQLESEHDNIHVVKWENSFNYSAINNFGVKYAKGEYILFLNNDTELIDPNSIYDMVGNCQRKEVGIVGAKLLYGDDTVQHCGVVLGSGGDIAHAFIDIDQDGDGYMCRARINSDYSAVTAACMMIKKSVFDEVNGFDESFAVAYNDIDLCLKVRDLDLLVVEDVFSMWYHYESKSRGKENTIEKSERFEKELKQFKSKWHKYWDAYDPCFNPNFSKTQQPFTLD